MELNFCLSLHFPGEEETSSSLIQINLAALLPKVCAQPSLRSSFSCPSRMVCSQWGGSTSEFLCVLACQPWDVWSHHHHPSMLCSSLRGPLGAVRESTEAGLSTLRLQPAPSLLPSGPASLCHACEPSSDHQLSASDPCLPEPRGKIFMCSISPTGVFSLRLQPGPSA